MNLAVACQKNSAADGELSTHCELACIAAFVLGQLCPIRPLHLAACLRCRYDHTERCSLGPHERCSILAALRAKTSSTLKYTPRKMAIS